VNAVSSGLDFKDKLDGGTAKAFAARMRGLAAASRSGAKQATNGARPIPRATAAPVDDEPLPF